MLDVHPVHHYKPTKKIKIIAFKKAKNRWPQKKE